MKRVLAGLALFALCALPFAPSANADEYKRYESDMFLRYIAYAVHPIGIALEYGVGRPIHWLVSRPDLDIWTGHKVDEDVTYEYFEWE